MRRAVFLDRDGTIIYDRGYMRDPALVELLPGAAEALRGLTTDGWALVVISNQSGVGRGLITLDEMKAVQARFVEMIRNEGVEIAASYLCAHRPDEHCRCRKPSTYHLELAGREHEIDMVDSWMIGDRRSDIQAGKNAGCRTIWFENPLFPVVPGLADYEARTWDEAAAIVRDASLRSRPSAQGK